MRGSRSLRLTLIELLVVIAIIGIPCCPLAARALASQTKGPANPVRQQSTPAGKSRCTIVLTDITVIDWRQE